MFWITLIFFAILGAILGSFLNVYILRLHTGKNTKGRSSCMTCGYPLKIIDLVPIFSFLFIKARCRNCKSKISIQYPIVETGSALLFLFLYAYIGLSYALPVLLFMALISFAIVVYDTKHHIIPQEFIIATWVSAILYVSANLFEVSNVNYFDLLVSKSISVLVFAGPIFIIWFLSKGKAMGYGDVKLAVPLALFFYPMQAYFAIISTFIIGAVVSLLYMLFLKLLGSNSKLNLKSEIAFAPFLIVTFWIFLFFSDFLTPLFSYGYNI